MIYYIIPILFSDPMKAPPTISIIIAACSLVVSYKFYEANKILEEENDVLIHMLDEYAAQYKELKLAKKKIKRLEYELDKYSTLHNKEIDNEIIRNKE